MQINPAVIQTTFRSVKPMKVKGAVRQTMMAEFIQQYIIQSRAILLANVEYTSLENIRCSAFIHHCDECTPSH